MSYTIIEADIVKNKSDLINLWKRNYPHLIQPEKRFNWMYEENPYGPPTCFLLKHNKSNNFIGAASLIPRRMFINDKPAMAAIAADFVIDKPHRSLGPALMLQRAIISECNKGKFKFIYGFPNKLAEPVHLKVGFKILGKTVRMVRLIHTYEKLAERTHPLIAKILSPLLDFTINFPNVLKPTDIFSEFLEYFDERFDHLWQKVPKNGQVIGERTASYLNWRYISDPYESYKIFVVCDKEKNLQGYIVYSIENKTVHIFDILSQDCYKALIKFFIIEIKRKCSINSISFMLFENCSIIKYLSSHYFLEREEPFNILTYMKQLTLPRSFEWYLVAGDKDVD